MREKITRKIKAAILRRARKIWRDDRAARARVRAHREGLERAQRFAERVVAGLISDLETR